MKKVISALLALIIMSGCIVPAFAYDLSPERKREIIISDTDVEDNVIIETEVTGVISEDKTQLILTPFEKKDEVGYIAISERLEDAIEEIDNCVNLGEIVPELETIKDDLNKSREGTKAETLNIEDFYVYDLFDVALIDGESTVVTTGDIYTYIKWQTTLKPGDSFYVFLKTEDGKWEPVEIRGLSEDGELSLALPGLGCIMIVCYSKHERFYNVSSPTSPRTAG